MQPDVLYTPYMMPPIGYENNYTNAVTTRFVKAASNKVRCPIFCVAWTPEGRRLITGTSSGEFTLWNGLTFNFETILQVIFSHANLILFLLDIEHIFFFELTFITKFKYLSRHTSIQYVVSACKVVYL